MRFLPFIFCYLITTATAASTDPQGDSYKYSLDLTAIEDDGLRVELITPAVDDNTIIFYMPKIIPGTYTISDFGRFVSDLKAFDREGNRLQVEHRDVNSWKIREARRLYKITYRVDDTYDATGGNLVSGMSGTNIEEGKNFLLNGGGFFGYLDGMLFRPFELSVTRPEGFYGSSAYDNHLMDGYRDYFEASDYHALLDMPVMYCKPDTALVHPGNTEVLISVYSPNNRVTSSFLKPRFAALLESQRAYLGGTLPVDRYAFLLYFMSDPLPITTGALEHNYSTVFCLPEINQERFSSLLVDIAAHEFFHIITPLNVHSEEIHYFDYNDPDMSRHLWMYEGVTEYFAHHNQVRSGLISVQAFLDRMSEKVYNSRMNYRDDLPFTKMSRRCLGKYENEYQNVYEKGALIGMCLDLALLGASNGTYSLVNLMADLSERFGDDKPFRDKRLIKEIEALTFPQIGDFLRTHVDGNQPIPYGRYLATAGIRYIPQQDTAVYTFGDASFGYNRESQRFFVSGTSNLNAMGKELGYQTGDELVRIQGEEIPVETVNAFVDRILSEMQEGEPFTVVVARKDKKRDEMIVTLEAPIRKTTRTRPPEMQVVQNATEAQLRLRKAWLGR